jgi:hypothetical protein
MVNSKIFGIIPRKIVRNFGGNETNQSKSSPFTVILNLNLRSNTPRKIPLDKKAIGFGAAGAGLVAVLSPFVVAAANGRLPEHFLSVKQKTGEVVRTVGCTLASDGNVCLQQIIQDRPR